MVTRIRKSLQKYLSWLHDHCISIEKFLHQVDLNEFMDEDHELHREAVLMKLQVIGEVIQQIHIHYPGVHGLPKQQAVGLRNLISHTYHKVDFRQIWYIGKNDIPVLYSTVLELLKNG